MTIDEQIGERLYVQMRRQKKTGVAAAEVLGIDQSSMSKKLNGTRPLALSELLALCEWLDLPIGDVLADLTMKGSDGVAESRCTLPSEIGSASLQVSALEGVAA